ncbi:DUF3343 domain-containing protein [Pseudoflavonifractor phocaeensis]|uniref:DUF3343 domain-containing protein n=1 Tax=Pseudoflavonifractor phocaeensis TaxID=1870988 RepID=UPI00195D1DB3|nr:DUF3343 domain-containing protein [Pseudoflavonifractor phocaeensis]MBM6869537.1 DUF3343 domain-containing protein [Pseudoflavonifractor phocaeensis]MBM6937469.1 DUF3343 domain-containing protein [Pseudoflavonifractor phocaeensis]
MREKKPALIVTFPTTTDAMGMERMCAENQLPGRLIPVPREISAGCGLAWKAPVDAQAHLTDAMSQAGLHWQEVRVLELWV